jgi:hypothetical protein
MRWYGSTLTSAGGRARGGGIHLPLIAGVNQKTGANGHGIVQDVLSGSHEFACRVEKKMHAVEPPGAVQYAGHAARH